ncbi:TPA: lpg1684 family Dot/Icm T4SS effector, partial [Legionella pneumophila]
IRPDHEFRVFVSRRHRKESIVTAISQYFHFLYFDKSPADCFNFLDEEDKKAVIKKFENYVLKSVDPDVAKFLNFSSEQDDDESSDCIREYIVDLALIPVSQYHGEITDENIIEIGANTYVMVVIELNPFAPAATGSGLFNWKNDLMMLWGKASCDYPVFKYRTTPREDLQSVSLLPSNYESVIKSALIKRLETSYSNSASQKERFFSSTKPVTESSGSALLDMVTKP